MRGDVDYAWTILMCGSRDWFNRQPIAEALETEKARLGVGVGRVRVIHGGAPGADTIVAEIASAGGFAVEAFPADWKRWGKPAGPIRNIEMVKQRPNVAYAFSFLADDGCSLTKGTGGIVRLLRVALVPTTVVTARRTECRPGAW